MSATFTLIEASISQVQQALSQGTVTSVELVAAFLNRIGFYDRHGISLNAVPILNPEVFAEARAADARRVAGQSIGPLDGIPFTIKDSYKAKGLTVASGSPAFAELVATEDAFTVTALREAGAVLIGKTTMPPMADGGMQRGVYGRAESPYNPDWLPAAFASGSSNGSGSATAANFAVFGMGEETVSSGRSPASNNALVAYTPSRGLISIRGNWPLYPTCDVVVPHTRSVSDLFDLLNVIVTPDPITRGDFWRNQDVVELPDPSQVRPEDFHSLADAHALAGVRLGVPKMYIGKDTENPEPIQTRDSVVALWEQARAHLEGLGAEVVEVELPVITNYEVEPGDAEGMYARGIVPSHWGAIEAFELLMFGWHDFLDQNADPKLHALKDVDGSQIFPRPAGALKDRYAPEGPLTPYVKLVEESAKGVASPAELPGYEQALRGLEKTREIDFEQWLDEQGLDAIVFPANADLGPADADLVQESADLAWSNGVFFSNGNCALRHLGIPSVTIPMGNLADIHMPVGLTFAGKAYADNDLLRYGFSYEQASRLRQTPPRTPELALERTMWEERDATESGAELADGFGITCEVNRGPISAEGTAQVTASGTIAAPENAQLIVGINGEQVPAQRTGTQWSATATVPIAAEPDPVGSNPRWDDALVVALVRSGSQSAGTYAELARTAD